MGTLTRSILMGLRFFFGILGIGAIIIVFTAPTLFGNIYFSTSLLTVLVLYGALGGIIGFLGNTAVQTVKNRKKV